MDMNKQQFDKQLIEGMKNLKYSSKKIEKPDFIIETKSSICGDKAVVYIKFENKKISDISYQHLGCGLNSLIFEEMIQYLIGTHIDEIKQKIDSYNSNLIIPENKKHCRDLVIQTFSKLIE